MVLTEMKEMVYGINPGLYVLYHEESEDGKYGIAVININGSHPCAYCKFPELDNNDVCDENRVCILTDADIHGGLTFLGQRVDAGLDGVWVGWDYAHFDDYICIGFDKKHENLFRIGHKWTTEEIVNELQTVLRDVKAGRFTILND